MDENNTRRGPAGGRSSCAVVAALSGASRCWWGTSPQGYWVWSRRCGREFIPYEDGMDRKRLPLWLRLRRRDEERVRSGVSL